MSILVLAISLGLLLIGVSFLFVPHKKEGTRDWPARFAIAATVGSIILLMWNWEYTKFVDKHGMYNFFPKHGLTVIAILAIAAYVAIVRVVWKGIDD